MKSISPTLSSCTIQRKDGAFCDKPSMVDTPFPICGYHARKLFHFMSDVVHEALSDPKRPVDMTAVWTARKANHKAALQKQSVVYYVRIHDYIKIGYTTNVKARMRQLRVRPDAVLATEPGGRDIEKDRHKQFADIRLGQQENFTPTPRLLAHIEAVREFHGGPDITGYLPNYLD